jgi:HD-like signal output (HDOD) protein
MKLAQIFSRESSTESFDTDPGLLFFARISDELASGPLNLPCFPDMVPRIRLALDDPDSTPDDIVRIAGAEPRLAARLLQTANSIVFNPNGKPVSHLRAAVTRLGHQTVQTVATVFAIQQMKAESALAPVTEPLNKLWEKSIVVAEICQLLARQLHVPTDKVFLLGLLHGIGHFYLLVRAAEESSEIAPCDLSPDLITERHPSLGREVLAKWGFENVFCEAVGNQQDHTRQSDRAADISDVLIASSVLAEVFLEGIRDLSPCENVTAVARLKLDPSKLEAVLVHTEHTIEALRDALAC